MTSKKHTRALMRAIAALGLTAISSPVAFAVAYTVVPAPGTQDWNTAASWTSTGGTTPGAAVGDTAAITGDFGGLGQTVNISATPANGITALTLGDTVASPTVPGATSVTASSGASLFGASGGLTITSNGSAGATNSISAPVSLAGGLTFGLGTNGLSVSGKISPTAAAARTIENASATTVTLGDIDLSTGATAATVTIRNGNNVGGANNVTVLNGTIADGSSVASALTIGSRLSGGTIQINGTNTYTGNTVVGLQSNQNTIIKINSDQPFGPAASGTLTMGNSAGATNTFEAIGGDRVITKNTTTINRNIAFQGTNSITFAATTLNALNTPIFTNNITATGKTVTLGSSGGSMFLNNNAVDLFRMREFTGAGTTIIASNIIENSGAAPTAQSKMVIKNSGTGTLVLAGTNSHQGGTRITSTGTVQIGNGGTSGTLDSGNSLVPVVAGTGAGTLAFNRTDAISTNIVANGPVNIVQKSGTVTLANSQFSWGNNTIGDGATASTLIVNGGVVAGSSTTSNANIATTASGTLTYRTVTLTGADTVASLGIKPGQPVWVTGGAASAASYVDAVLSATTFSVFGETLLTATPSALTFGGGSGLGTTTATTTVSNLATLGGTGAIAGAVNALTGSTIAPGAPGAAGTLSTGELTLGGATLEFDLSQSVASGNDLISVLNGGTVNFSNLTFSFTATTPGLFEVGNSYDLISTTGGFTGDVNTIATILDGSEAGLYSPAYAVSNRSGTNFLVVTFTAIPEPSTFAIAAGALALGASLLRRRKQA